jgi:large subunit ribosomal protein L31
MKQDIHPSYYQDAKIICACGAVYHIPSTVRAMQVEICSNCHPYYTGTAKLIDTARRIDKFRARLEKAKAAQSKVKSKKSKVEVA